MCFRVILSADASVVDLHKLGPHFYELGLHVLPLTTPSDSAALAKLLTQVVEIYCIRGITFYNLRAYFISVSYLAKNTLI